MALFGAARRLGEPALERLQQHALFSFQIRDAHVAARVRELRELLRAARDEPDQGELLAELVHEIEEQLMNDPREMFLLASLQKFAQEVELLLDLDGGDLAGGSGLVWSDRAPALSRGSYVTRKPSSKPVVSAPPAATVKKQEDELRCGVCWQPDSLESDPIVICEICGVAVHQTCYRIDELPDGDWFCQPCARYTRLQVAGNSSALLVPTHELECQACLVKGGALVPSASASAGRDAWVHLVCTMFLPELYVLSSDRQMMTATGSGHQQVFGGVVRPTADANRPLIRLSDLSDLNGACQWQEKLGARRRLRCCFCKTGYVRITRTRVGRPGLM